jgi:hypothetical protein
MQTCVFQKLVCTKHFRGWHGSTFSYRPDAPVSAAQFNGAVNMAGSFHHLRQMPKALAALTLLFTCCGFLCVVLAVLPINWQNDDSVLALEAGAVMALLVIGFYRAQGWVRYAVPLGLAYCSVHSVLRPDPYDPYPWVGSLFWGILAPSPHQMNRWGGYKCPFCRFWTKSTDHILGRPGAEPRRY